MIAGLVYFSSREERSPALAAQQLAERGADTQASAISRRVETSQAASGDARTPPRADYSNVGNHTPIEGDAGQVIAQLLPLARSGDTGAAIDIYVKANDCRLTTANARRQAPNTDPDALVPDNCRSLTPESYKEAARWLETAADAGNVDAQFLYAYSPEGVLGPPVDWLKDPEAVSKYKRKAMGFLNAHAADGSIDAILELSEAYQTGVLAQRDPVKALAYYKAAQFKDPSSVLDGRMKVMENMLSPSDVAAAEKQGRLIYASCCQPVARVRPKGRTRDRSRRVRAMLRCRNRVRPFPELLASETHP